MDVKKITYALSAIAESVYQITCIAQDGVVNTGIISSLLRGVLKTQCDHTADIYPEKNLRNGLIYFADTSKLESQKVVEMTRYLSSILSLCNVYLAKPEIRANLGNEIQKIKENLVMQEDKAAYVCRHLGSWYGKNITEAGVFAIKIFGAEQHLSRETNLIYIRSLLASALRACVLWRQVGGTQMNLLFNKSQISICARQMLNNLS